MSEESGVETCQRSGCDDEPEVTMYFHRTQEENQYCLEHAEEALEEFEDARVGDSLQTEDSE